MTVGMSVMLREDHGYSRGFINGLSVNPVNIPGVIVEVLGNGFDFAQPIQVEWSNGHLNSYDKGDLILINGVKPVKMIKKHKIC